MKLKKPQSYRDMVKMVINPILNYFTFLINGDGFIEKFGTGKGITIDGKHLYIPENGADAFTLRDSGEYEIFCLRNREHVLILADRIRKVFSMKYRDADDTAIGPDGELAPIVTLVKRHIQPGDKLPAKFAGVIYELVCREDTEDEEILSMGYDATGDDIKAILMTLIKVIQLRSTPVFVADDKWFTRLFRYMDVQEKIKDKELEAARDEWTTNNTGLDLTGDHIADGIEDDSASEVEEYQRSHVNDVIIEDDDIYDGIEF